MTVLELVASFALIVGGAVGFTNAVEWLGFRLNLAEGAVGALLAAVGTALPESVIPVVALIDGGGDEESVQVAIGAIIGAPFVLGTLAMLVIAVSVHVFSGRREQGSTVTGERSAIRRDIAWFLVLFPPAIVLGVLHAPAPLRYAAAAVLVAGYGIYAWRTASAEGEAEAEDELGSLYFDPSKKDPPSTFQITLQFVVSLAAIIGGAELFVGVVETIATSLGVTPLVLALVLAPLATELPEKANSVIWVRQGKDSLALGNITGAMVFQASVPVSLGLILTEWQLETQAVVAAVVGIAGGALARWALPRGTVGMTATAVWAGLFTGFVAYAAMS
jgi:cation:H+ antiporter